MDMAATVEVNFARVNKALDKFLEGKTYDAKLVYWDQMRLWLNDLIRRMPPFGANMLINFDAGKTAIANDMLRIFAAMENQDYLDQMTRDAQKRDPIYRTVNGEPVKISREQVAGTQSLEQWHSSHRSSYTGRTVFQGDKAFGWRGRMLVMQSQIDALVDSLSGHIGKLASGWLRAARYFAAKSAGKVASYGFVDRHAEPGDFLDTLNTEGSGVLVSSNDVPYANKHPVKSAINATGVTRQRDLELWLEKRIEKRCKEWNAAGLAA